MGSTHSGGASLYDFDGHRAKAIEHLNRAMLDAEICMALPVDGDWRVRGKSPPGLWQDAGATICATLKLRKAASMDAAFNLLEQIPKLTLRKQPVQMSRYLGPKV
jgi:hypothetical protein